MAPTKEQVQSLIQARNASYAAAFASLDIEAVKAWHSKAIVYTDIVDHFFTSQALTAAALDQYNMNDVVSRESLKRGFQMMDSWTFLETSTTGTIEFTTWEMRFDLTFNIDEPILGIEKGKKASIRGVSLLWWRWEGESEWIGDLSEEAMRDWKIVKQRDYMVKLSGAEKGCEIKIFRDDK